MTLTVLLQLSAVHSCTTYLGGQACKLVSHFSSHRINPNEITQLPAHAKLCEEKAQKKQNSISLPSLPLHESAETIQAKKSNLRYEGALKGISVRGQ